MAHDTADALTARYVNSPGQHRCPECATDHNEAQLTESLYRCVKCGLELAHIDVAPTGGVRGVFGYLHPEGDIILDRYRVKSVLGKGGFAATYLVEDQRLKGKTRAIKEIPELLFDEGETDLLSRLHHRAIPDIMDRQINDGMVYLVLEFGGSRTLESERRRLGGQIPHSQLVVWMRELCDVLAYLHSNDPPIVHRDLKPANILLSEDNSPMLIDFGIAKEATAATETRTLARAASSGFSPPEQALGTGTDERSDIYALGATLYALLTGKTPPGAHERIAGTELQAPSEIVEGLPGSLDAAVVRALDLNINRRQQSIAEFAQVFDELLGVGGTAPILDDTKTMTIDQARRTGRTGPGQVSVSEVDLRTAGTAPVKRPAWIPVAVATAVIGALAMGGYSYLGNQSDPEPEVSSTTPVDKVGDPIGLPPVGGIPKKAASDPASDTQRGDISTAHTSVLTGEIPVTKTEIQTNIPVDPNIPVDSIGESGEDGPSAMDILDSGSTARDDQETVLSKVDKPEVVPVVASKPVTKSTPKPRPKPVRRPPRKPPVRQARAPASVRPSPKPAPVVKKPKPKWVIIPGDMHEKY